MEKEKKRKQPLQHQWTTTDRFQADLDMMETWKIQAILAHYDILKPFIFSIHSDGGEEIEELYGDDFKEISFESFNIIKGDRENTLKLLYNCIFEFDESKFVHFKNALDNSSNLIEVKLGFKDQSGKEIDHEDLYEGFSDVPTELTKL